jgi:hypothetical protein
MSNIISSNYLLSDLSKALLGFLSYNDQNQAQNNTVVPSQKEMDRVGFEPTTSAMPATFYLREAMERELAAVLFSAVIHP